MAARVEAARQAAGITKTHLRHALGLGRTAWNSRMTGEVAFTIPEGLTLADALHVSLDYLATGRAAELDEKALAS